MLSFFVPKLQSQEFKHDTVIRSQVIYAIHGLKIYISENLFYENPHQHRGMF